MMGSVTLEFLNLKLFYLLAHWTNPENKFSHWSPFSTLKKSKLLQKKPALCSCQSLAQSMILQGTSMTNSKQRCWSFSKKKIYMKSMCPTVLIFTKRRDSFMFLVNMRASGYLMDPHLNPGEQVLCHSPDLGEKITCENKPL